MDQPSDARAAGDAGAGGRRGWLIAYRPDRLGARLVSLMNAMRLAETLGAEFRCAWVPSTGATEAINDPTELFDADFVRRQFLRQDEWRALRHETLVLSGHAGRTPQELAAAVANGDDLLVGNAFGIIRLEGEAEADVIARFRAQFARIPFSAPVAAALQMLAQSLAGHTAYHIRRGDLTDDLKAMNKPWPHKVVPDEFYERHMAAELARGQRGLVLFSDEAATIGHFRAAFPQVTTIADLVDSGGLTEAQRDLIELCAMSRCERIIAPDRSAFSSTAADIGGAVKVAVTDSMAPDQADAAADALYRRLRDRPDSFPGEGEIGQALAHTGAWLEREGRLADAAALFAQHVEAGLNISFVYPQTMRYQNQAGALDGVLRTARRMAAGHVVHVKDYAAAELLHGYAHLRRGERALAVRHIVNGFWHAPDAGTARLLIPVLLESGLLGEANFLPVSELQLGLQRRRGPLKLLPSDFPGLSAVPGVHLPRAIGGLETALWDWAPLMPAVSMNAALRKGAVAAAAERLDRARTAPEDEPERASLAAILRAHAGKADEAAAELAGLAAGPDARAMTWQRLSHAHWKVRRFGEAAEAAVRAAATADWPAIRAWAGMALLRVRENDAAVGHLLAAEAALPGWPAIAGLLAQALDRAGRRAEGLAAAGRALELAPMEVEFAMLRARLLDAAGRTPEAVALLDRMVELQRAPGKLFLALIDMLQRLGESERARAMLDLARVRVPRHPRIAELAGAD